MSETNAHLGLTQSREDRHDLEYVNEDYLNNMDELVNSKIVIGMKKAVSMIFDKFDILCE